MSCGVWSLSICTALVRARALSPHPEVLTKRIPQDGSPATPEIHGLTTATSVWLSAAVGLLCGGGLYLLSFFATAVGVVYLRFAPRLAPSFPDLDQSGHDDLEELRVPLNPNTESPASGRPDEAPSNASTTKQPPSPKRENSARISKSRDNSSAARRASIFA